MNNEALNTENNPPNPLLEARNLVKRYENGELRVTPDDLVIIQSLSRIVGSVSLETAIEISV